MKFEMTYQRLLLVFCFCLLSFAAMGWRVNADLPASEFADTEVTTNLVKSLYLRTRGHLDVSLDFEGTASNNVEIAFGTDRDEDGALAFSETEMTLGWNCGSWFVWGGADEVFLQEESATTNAEQHLFYQARTNRQGALQTLVISNATEQVFTMLSEAKPAWMHQPYWNIMRLTARGLTNPEAQFQIVSEVFGFSIHIR